MSQCYTCLDSSRQSADGEVVFVAKEILGRCGCCRCDLCPAYNGNIKSFADRQRVSEGWLEYFGLNMLPEEVGCSGCLGEGKLMRTNAGCPIRSCVRQRGIERCELCDNPACGKLKSLLESIERAVRDHQGMSESDYDAFIRPFKNRGTQ